MDALNLHWCGDLKIYTQILTAIAELSWSTVLFVFFPNEWKNMCCREDKLKIAPCFSHYANTVSQI